MKTLRSVFLLCVVTFIASTVNVMAQITHYVFDFQIENWQFTCPQTQNVLSISGTATYQLTVFANPKTGNIERIHNNVLHADIYNSITLEKYRYMDTGACDNLGTWWPEWLGIYPEQPAEGSTVASAGLKIVGKGGTLYRIKLVMQVHINANGYPVVDSEKGWVECDF